MNMVSVYTRGRLDKTGLFGSEKWQRSNNNINHLNDANQLNVIDGRLTGLGIVRNSGLKLVLFLWFSGLLDTSILLLLFAANTKQMPLNWPVRNAGTQQIFATKQTCAGKFDAI